jgi:endonuclease G
MSARGRTGSPRGRGLKAVFWFNAILLAVMGGWFVMQPPARREEVAKLVENYFEKNKRIALTDVALDLYRLYYSGDFVAASAPGDRAQVYGGLPRPAGFPHAIRVLRNRGYVAGYCEALENPAWAAYRVADVQGLPEAAPRPEGFEADLRPGWSPPRIRTADTIAGTWRRITRSPRATARRRSGRRFSCPTSPRSAMR